MASMSEFPREPRVSIPNNDPVADLEALNIEDPDIVSAPEIIWYISYFAVSHSFTLVRIWSDNGVPHYTQAFEIIDQSAGDNQHRTRGKWKINCRQSPFRSNNTEVQKRATKESNHQIGIRKRQNIQVFTQVLHIGSKCLNHLCTKQANQPNAARARELPRFRKYFIRGFSQAGDRVRLEL